MNSVLVMLFVMVSLGLLRLKMMRGFTYFWNTPITLDFDPLIPKYCMLETPLKKKSIEI